MIDNKAIFHYLNPEGCWHEANQKSIAVGLKYTSCIHCRTTMPVDYDDDYNPDYTTEHGFFLLLEGLRAKEFEVETHGLNEYTVEQSDLFNL